MTISIQSTCCISIVNFLQSRHYPGQHPPVLTRHPIPTNAFPPSPPPSPRPSPPPHTSLAQENEYVLQQCCVISPGRNAQYQNGSGTSDGAFSNMARAAPPPLLKAKSYSSPGRRAPNQSACVGNSVTRARYIKDPEGKTTRNKTDHPFLSSTYWGSSSSSRSRRGRGSCECSDNGNTISYGDGMSKDGVNNGCYAGTRSTDNLSLEDWFDDHASSRGGGGWRGTRSGGVRGGGTGGESVSARWSEWKTVCRTRKTSATVQLPRPLSRPHGLRYRVGARRRREKGKQVKFR